MEQLFIANYVDKLLKDSLSTRQSVFDFIPGTNRCRGSSTLMLAQEPYNDSTSTLLNREMSRLGSWGSTHNKHVERKKRFMPSYFT